MIVNSSTINDYANHYYIQEKIIKHPLSSTTEKIIHLNPRLLLGESNLFSYDATNHVLALSPSFHSLLTLLVQLGELDPRALTATSLQQLNSVLQQSQGAKGGLLRKEGTERWHMQDNPTKQQYLQNFDELFQQLGFVFPKWVNKPITVDHCIIFGARVERMKKRIIDTLEYLKNNLEVTGNINLLGSNRALTKEEKAALKEEIEKLDDFQKNYWNNVFNDSELSTEANAFVCLWACIAPPELQKLFKDRVVGINSIRIGNSSHDHSGQRPTTEITIEDWMTFYDPKKPQSIFALIEGPYLRLLDQLKISVVSDNKKAKIDEVIERIQNTTFFFAFAKANSAPLISVVLDEIGRNVYRIVDTLKYFENL